MKVARVKKEGDIVRVTLEHGTDSPVDINQAFRMALDEASKLSSARLAIAGPPSIRMVKADGAITADMDAAEKVYVDVLCGPQLDVKIVETRVEGPNVIVELEADSRDKLLQHDAYALALSEARKLGFNDPAVLSFPEVTAVNEVGVDIGMPGEAKRVRFRAKVVCGSLSPW